VCRAGANLGEAVAATPLAIGAAAASERRSPMKRRALLLDATAEIPAHSLAHAFLKLRTAAEVQKLLVDLCTPAELEALTDRWRVVPHLLQTQPYREIHEQTAVSVTTIGRVARCLLVGAGGYRLAANRLGVKSTEAKPLAARRSGAGKRTTTTPKPTRRRSSQGKQK